MAKKFHARRAMNERCGCGVTNTGAARFCRECGHPLAALAVTPPAALVAIRRCAHCATKNALISKFCTSCGATLPRLELTGSIDAAPEQRGRPLARKAAIAFAALFAFALLAQGTSYWYRIDRERTAALAETARLQEQARRRDLELQRLALAEAARRPSAQSGREEILPPERVIEPATATRRPAAADPTRAVPKRAQPVRALVAKKDRRARPDDSAVAGREPARPVEAAPAAAVAQPRVAPVPMAVVQASPQSLCQSKSNFLSRAICDALECAKEQFAQSRYCQAVREQGARSISQSQ
jgi:hypothetical protein